MLVLFTCFTLWFYSLSGILQVIPEEEEKTILQTEVNYQKGGRKDEAFHHQAYSITDDETGPCLHQSKEWWESGKRSSLFVVSFSWRIMA